METLSLIAIDFRTEIDIHTETNRDDSAKQRNIFTLYNYENSLTWNIPCF